MSFSVYLVRHGQTILNKYRRMQGWCDSPLTEKGIGDGKQAGKNLADIKFDFAYHSDTTRAARTCGLILAANHHADGLAPVVNKNFREQFYGYFEGHDSANTWVMIGGPHGVLTYEDLVSQYSIGKSRDFLKETDPFGDGENDAEFWQRIDAGFDNLRQKHHDNEKILIVSHGTTIRSIVNRYAPEIDVINHKPQNGSTTKLTVDTDTIKVDYYNHYDDHEEY